MYANVILPMPLDGTFSYAVPAELADKTGVGFRVIVPFGKKHYYTGLIESLTAEKPDHINIREIVDVLDDKPIVRPEQIQFWRWMSEYYLCTIGEVFKAALPAGLKIESETRISIDERATPEDFATLGSDALAMVEFVRSQNSVTLDAATAKSGVPRAGAVITALIEEGILSVSEKLEIGRAHV